MTTRFRWLCLPLGLGALFLALVVTLTGTAGAQTPEETDAQGTFALPTGTGEIITPGDTTPEPSALASPTEEPTPGPEVQTLVRLEVPTTVEQPVPEGDEFEIQVFVDKVEHLAGFEFSLGYDPDKLEPVIVSGTEGATPEQGTPVAGGSNVVKMTSLGQIFLDGGRDQSGFLCSEPLVRGNAALVTCSLLEAPVCAGGAPGVSGDGLLASVFFKAKGGGTTTIEVDKSTLVLDDVALPCPQSEEEDFVIQTIPHRRQGVDVELKADEGSSLLLIVGIVVVVVVVAGAAGGGYFWYRRRQSPT